MSVLSSLRHAGLLGINRRNAEYTLRQNPRRNYPKVDDKLLTKKLCDAASIPNPRLLVTAPSQADVVRLLDPLEKESAFVIKPAHGAMGNGILVIVAREGDRFQQAGGGWIDGEDVRYHASGILSGLYSLGGQPDVAFVEERLEVHPELRAIASEGVPDLRVVVYRGIPVMAMTRLPTRKSRGRANLHHGAVGVGIDLARGRTTHAVIQGATTKRHPDTRERVVGRALPEFGRALEIAVRATDETDLGYVGADVVVDATRGPVLLEMNARPGLAIQIANQAGLRPRLAWVDRVYRPGLSLTRRLELGREIGASLDD